MPPKRVLIRRHLPLITPRIAFEIQPMPAPPPLTLRMNLAERIRRRAIIDQDPNPQIHAPPVAVLPKPTSNKGVRPGPSENKKIVPTDDNEGTITDGSESDLTDLDDVVDPEDTGTSQHAVQRTGKIPKPRGEAGRPGSGGFNLEESLGWSKDYFASVQKRTYDLAIPMLDDSKSYNKQPSYKLDRICKKLEGEFRRLSDYENTWPVRCMIKAKLKSSSEIARRQANRGGTSKGTAVSNRSSLSPAFEVPANMVTF